MFQSRQVHWSPKAEPSSPLLVNCTSVHSVLKAARVGKRELGEVKGGVGFEGGGQGQHTEGVIVGSGVERRRSAGDIELQYGVIGVIIDAG